MHPAPSPARANFTLITECTPESSGCNSVHSVVYTVSGCGGGVGGVTLCCRPILREFYTPFLARAGIFKQSMGARYRVGMGLSYEPNSLAQFIPWNRFLGSINV